jgi:hypothetical protein
MEALDPLAFMPPNAMAERHPHCGVPTLEDIGLCIAMFGHPRRRAYHWDWLLAMVDATAILQGSRTSTSSPTTFAPYRFLVTRNVLSAAPGQEPTVVHTDYPWSFTYATILKAPIHEVYCTRRRRRRRDLLFFSCAFCNRPAAPRPAALLPVEEGII